MSFSENPQVHQIIQNDLDMLKVKRILNALTNSRNEIVFWVNELVFLNIFLTIAVCGFYGTFAAAYLNS